MGVYGRNVAAQQMHSDSLRTPAPTPLEAIPAPENVQGHGQGPLPGLPKSEDQVAYTTDAGQVMVAPVANVGSPPGASPPDSTPMVAADSAAVAPIAAPALSKSAASSDMANVPAPGLSEPVQKKKKSSICAVL